MRDYIHYILKLMEDQGLSVRRLAMRTGIPRQRLTNILRRDTEHRSGQCMTVPELQTILCAFDLGLTEAILGVEVLRRPADAHDPRYTTLMQMISELVARLPIRLITELSGVDGMDGTEIRREWAAPLCNGLVDRVVHEVSMIIKRRGALDQLFRFD